MHNLKLHENLCNLPFDQYSRQYWVAQFIEQSRKGREKFSIVDVGGYKGQTTEFQHKDTVTVCDLFDVEEKGYIKADGTKLPFTEDQFDISVSFDAYEHIPKPKRKAFLTELLRVGSKATIIAAPFDTDGKDTINAEKRLNQYYYDLYGKEHQWLKEHIDYQTPKGSDLEKAVTSLGYGFVKFSTNDRIIWQLLQGVYFSIELDHDLRERAHELNWLYNNNVLKIDPATEGNSYRTIYFITKNKALLASVGKFIKQVPTQDRQYAEVFTAKIMYIFGLKYRDVVNHRNHLEKQTSALRSMNVKGRMLKLKNSIHHKHKGGVSNESK